MTQGSAEEGPQGTVWHCGPDQEPFGTIETQQVPDGQQSAVVVQYCEKAGPLASGGSFCEGS